MELTDIKHILTKFEKLLQKEVKVLKIKFGKVNENSYTYICYHENNVPSRLSPQWLCDNSCTWAHDVRLPSA